MLLSKASGYAINGLVFIAVRNGAMSVGVREIAEFHGISRSYLAKIFQVLSRNDIVRSMRGVRGGYRLSRAAENITIADVVNAVDGPVEQGICCLQLDGCPFHETCAVCKAVDRVNAEMLTLFAGTTIRDLALRHEPFISLVEAIR
jgi:Rrf2 family protein